MKVIVELPGFMINFEMTILYSHRDSDYCRYVMHHCPDKVE